MVLLAIDQFSGERQRSSDILLRDGVLAFDVFEAHTAGEAAHDDRDRRPRPADDGLAMANLRIDDDALTHEIRLRGPADGPARPRTRTAVNEEDQRLDIEMTSRQECFGKNGLERVSATCTRLESRL